MKNAFQLITKFVAYIFALLILLFVVVSICLKGLSPGTTKPITDSGGEIIKESIAEINYLNINGIEQFVLIRGNNINNPVLLMIHGGPGSPQAHMNCKYNKELEEHYVVVNWDQRGAGASFYDNINSQNLNIEILIDDTKELTNYLRNRFNQDKIFILGHSWGSYLGMKTIHKYPELYHAYIGIGQVSNQRKSEELSYEFVYNTAKKNNNKKAISQLEEIGYPTNGVYKNRDKSMMIERNWVSNFGGAAHELTQKDLIKFFIFPLINFKEYRVIDKINYIRGITQTQEVIWETLLNHQLIDEVKEVEIPIYILQGIYDYQTVHSLAKAYIDSLKAPHKEFITFSNSAHMVPYNQEIEKYHKLLIEKIPTEILGK